MTINGLNEFIKRKFVSNGIQVAYNKIPLSKLKQKRIAIDCSEYMYSYYNVVKKDILSSDKWERRFVNGAWQRPSEKDIAFGVCKRFISLSHQLMLCENTPIFVFDGEPYEAKSSTKAMRSERHKKAKEELERAMADPSNYDLYAQRELRCGIPPKEYKEELSDLFTVMGIRHYHAPNESDTLCAQLCRDGLADIIMSQDCDQIAYGAGTIIKKYEFILGEPYITFTHPHVLYGGLNLTHKQMIDFCVMCGTDYNNNVPHNGPETCFSLIKKYGSLDAVASVDSRYDNEEMRTARSIFTMQIQVPQPNVSNITPDEYIARWAHNNEMLQYMKDWIVTFRSLLP